MPFDPYLYPNSTTLQNLLGIRDKNQLAIAEARVAALSLKRLDRNPLPIPFGEVRFKATHRAIFSYLYAWAGEYRKDTGPMSKDRAIGYCVSYGDSLYVPMEMSRIFAEFSAERYLEGLGPDQFSHRLAYFYSEMDAVHPFREGNSRTLRKFSSDLARQAGYELDWTPMASTDETRNELYRARDLGAMRREYGPLTAIIRRNLRLL